MAALLMCFTFTLNPKYRLILSSFVRKHQSDNHTYKLLLEFGEGFNSAFRE